jgi:hypothetical protein
MPLPANRNRISFILDEGDLMLAAMRQANSSASSESR